MGQIVLKWIKLSKKISQNLNLVRGYENSTELDEVAKTFDFNEA